MDSVVTVVVETAAGAIDYVQDTAAAALDGSIIEDLMGAVVSFLGDVVADAAMSIVKSVVPAQVLSHIEK